MEQTQRDDIATHFMLEFLRHSCVDLDSDDIVRMVKVNGVRKTAELFAISYAEDVITSERKAS
jgi:hypothetical protein